MKSLKAGSHTRASRIVAGPAKPIRVPDSCVVFTPRPLAVAMVAALGDLPRAMWLEPCVGAGVFLSALNDSGVSSKRIRAIDLATTAHPNDANARTLRGVEFLSWSVATRERFSRIVANPPFIALNCLAKRIQRHATEICIPGTESKVSLGANAWYAFLCASVSLLSLGGSLAFVLPAAWEYSNYAAPLREQLS